MAVLLPSSGSGVMLGAPWVGVAVIRDETVGEAVPREDERAGAPAQSKNPQQYSGNVAKMKPSSPS